MGTQNGVLHGPMGAFLRPAAPLRDGKHVSFNLMFDRLAMLEQLGPTPAVAGVATS